MFGYRTDGVDVSKTLDPMVLFTPLIMPTRCESMNNVIYPAEYEPMANYIRAQRVQGNNISFQTIMAAAYVRTLKKYPYLNYFVMGRRVYRHKDITLSLIVLRDTPDGSVKEAAVKVVCDPDDTIQDVSRKFDEQVAIAKQVAESNATADFAGTLLRIPVLPNLVVLLARVMDRLGILPRCLEKLSPFHCSLFITNMMSIGLPAIHHHLYNFGTCSIFLSLGKPERQTVTAGGRAARKLMIPMGIVTDERICGGAEYAIGVHTFLQYLQHPELLELTPAEEEARKAAESADNVTPISG
jgi:pyruvate/2-oxoglutarate dehydrogenase complex dihydrolipoamide acyltransferase (E2) component